MGCKYKKENMPKLTKAISDFKNFIETCIIGNKSMLIEPDGDVFTNGNIDVCIKKVQEIVEANKKAKSEGKETKDLWEEIKKKKLPQEQLIIIQHALWFVDFAIENRDFTKKDYATNFKDEYKVNTGIGAARQCFSGSVRGDVELNVLENWKEWKGLKTDKFDTFKTTFTDNYDKVKADEKSLHPSLRNIILYLCDQDNYEPVITDSDKNAIVSILYPLFVSSKDKPQKIDRETTIQNIKEKMSEKMSEYYPALKDSAAFFYEPAIVGFWKSDNGLTVAQQLEYKKAMILYGPPGTGKTHDVGVLIDQIATNFYLRHKNADGYKEKLDKYRKGGEQYKKKFKKVCKKKHVLNLQMHVNYSYDDFVIGQVFEDGKTKVQKGELLKFIEKINEDNKGKDSKDYAPFFVVLDEINRVDISRVFGEVFSAMEYRGKEIDLPYGEKLCIPENLYFIGTMNEIDFSLEHIDFALRRRFVWVRKGFDKDALKDIIEYKLTKLVQKEQKPKILDWDIDAYSDVCESLNKKITEESTLGENYEIGHTFFAEIVPIYGKLLENDGDATIGQAKQILWQISIKPTLEAYCGSMPETTRQNFIGEDAKGTDKKGSCRAIFIGSDQSVVSSNE